DPRVGKRQPVFPPSHRWRIYGHHQDRAAGTTRAREGHRRADRRAHRDHGRRVDATGKTIIPGLIDTHKHTTREARDILSQQSWEMASNLAHGITTALEPSGTPEAIFTMAEDV